MRIKSADDIAAKWARVAPGRQADFKTGVTDTAVDWAKPTAAAADSYVAGVTDAIQRGGFAKGVEKAGTDKWRRKVSDVGVARWGPGVLAAQADMSSAIAPYVDALSRTTLPPKGPRNDPRNLERVAVVARVLGDTRRK